MFFLLRFNAIRNMVLISIKNVNLVFYNVIILMLKFGTIKDNLILINDSLEYFKNFRSNFEKIDLK